MDSKTPKQPLGSHHSFSSNLFKATVRWASNSLLVDATTATTPAARSAYATPGIQTACSTDAEETVTFGLDGTSYEIDLNDANASALRDTLGAYIGHGRKVTGSRGRGRRASAGAAASGTSAKDIRVWARSNGHDVPERGRIPADVREAYEAAN